MEQEPNDITGLMDMSESYMSGLDWHIGRPMPSTEAERSLRDISKPGYEATEQGTFDIYCHVQKMVFGELMDPGKGYGASMKSYQE